MHTRTRDYVMRSERAGSWNIGRRFSPVYS